PADAEVEDAAVSQIAMPTGDPLGWPVDAVGPFNVGHRAFDVTYTPPGQTSARTIPVDLWYPTLDAEGENPKYLMLFGDPDVFENASVAPPVHVYPDGKGYPVHVYSHGSNGFGGTSSDMAHWFASHGWVYVAPNHVGNLLGAGEGKRPVSLYYLRDTDITAALDGVEKLAAPDPLAGKLRTKRVLMSGHSFGTITAWASGGATFDPVAIKAKCDAGEFTDPCKPEELDVFAKGVTDPRVVASIPMAGSASDWFTADGYDAPTIPFLIMSGTEDSSSGPIFDRVKKLDLTWLSFIGGCHQLFALGGCPKFDEKLGWKLTNTWAFAFGRRHVLGDASAGVEKIIKGEQSLSDKIEYHHEGAFTPPKAP
ncbi:MAG: alpha/beta hydrolase family protein, partial [Polyangiales bacterium]